MAESPTQLPSGLKNAEELKNVQYLPLEELIQGAKAEKEIIIAGAEKGPYRVRIRKLSTEDFAAIHTYAGEDPIKSVIAMVLRGCVIPRMTDPAQVAALPLHVNNEIAAAIAEFSGITPESAQRVRGFLEPDKT